MSAPPGEGPGSTVVASLDELLSDPELLPEWLRVVERLTDVLTLLVHAPDRTHDEIEDLLWKRFAQLGIDPDAAPSLQVGAISTRDDRELAREAFARFSRKPTVGPLALLPRFFDERNILRSARRNHAAARRETHHPTGPPDFVGVGVPRAGTSWWSWLLDEHPEIRIETKELDFFDGLRDLSPAELPVAAYHRLFPRPRNELAGEFSPGYMFRPWAIPLLKEAAPDAKLLVLLRDPVERYRSALSRAQSIGDPPTEQRRRTAFERGLYAGQLERLFKHFPRGRVLVLQYERCASQPRAELERTLRFLGVEEPTFVPPAIGRRVNATRIEKLPVEGEIRATLVAAYREDAVKLVELVPELELGLWTSLGLD